jgi:hypothetical protein
MRGDMARESTEDVNPQTAALIAALAGSIASIAPKKEIREGDPEYVARLKAEGFYDDFFGKTIYQNAYEANPRGQSEQTRRRASELKAGTHTLKKGRKVDVIVDGNTITLGYKVKGDGLMINQQSWDSFEDLINQLWEQQNTVTA